MKFIPYDYQKYAIRYIESHPIAAVLLDMGLGKTVITLTAIRNLMYERREISHVLVIAPLRVARNTWPEEIKKWDHLKGLSYSLIVGSAKQRQEALQAEADIYIINRENLTWLVENSSADLTRFDMIVIDELSSFKSWKAKRFKALMQMRPNVKRIVGLTGTPSSNGLMDLFAEYKVLDMGERLGRSIYQYRSKYFLPDRTNGNIVYSYKPKKNAEQEIYNRISDITISMKAADYLPMPEIIYREYPVYLNAKERGLYEGMKKDFILQGQENEVTVKNAAVLANKLSQMANGAIYGDGKNVISIHERKLDALEDIIESMNGRPLLVAYSYRHDLKRIEERLRKNQILFSELNTDESIAEWNLGKIPVALIHPASAGHGLNLQDGGNTLVWFDIPWSLEQYEQTIARINRQGQNAETVVIQHIITKGTIDERIISILKKKDRSQSALLEAVKADLQQ